MPVTVRIPGVAGSPCPRGAAGARHLSRLCSEIIPPWHWQATEPALQIMRQRPQLGMKAFSKRFGPSGQTLLDLKPLVLLHNPRLHEQMRLPSCITTAGAVQVLTVRTFNGKFLPWADSDHQLEDRLAVHRHAIRSLWHCAQAPFRESGGWPGYSLAVGTQWFRSDSVDSSVINDGGDGESCTVHGIRPCR
jgi:hypothetical protein